MKPILEGDVVLLFSGSSAAAFKFPRELASREFMEKLNEKHRWGRGGGWGGHRQPCILMHCSCL